ncbi:MAG: diadenylate cyclase CdaA [Butyrivibrio sp.]|nr:diadenylate cyclase CdaA [Butyrivibrio sp.]
MQLDHLFEINLSNLNNLRLPRIRLWPDVVEILIIALLIYEVLVWARRTRLWSLLKGVIFIAVFIIFADICGMSTIMWIAQNVFQIAVIAVIVILQPELRKALEELGQTNLFSGVLSFADTRETGLFSDKTISEITRACVEMGKVRTGALIVIEQNQSLAEYERTGIDVDAIVTSQLLINIFEHNTPLHDGAVIVRGDRITSATCYLPLSDNMQLGKELGTRHRAGVGVSEVTDSLTVIVSEETGKISVAYHGVLESGVDSGRLGERLREIQNKEPVDRKTRTRKLREKVIA